MENLDNKKNNFSLLSI